MSVGDQGASTQPERPTAKKATWFVSNRSGMGYHPQTWQGWLVIAGVVAVIVTVVVLLRRALS